MSFFPTKYPQGTFSWADFFSKYIEKTKPFYNDLFGWTSEDMPTGDGRPDYTMFSMDSKYTAGGGPAFDPNMPSFWNNYITVDDVDAMTKKAEELGAKVMMPPMDVLDSGRMSNITDPTGAHVALWQPNKHIGAGVINTIGAMGWNELYTHDVEKARKFYADLLGWTYDINEEMKYTVIKNNGRSNGGMMEITPEMQGMIPCWMVYFTVKNLDESMAKVKELRGSVMMGPKTIGPGKIAGIMDPAGAAFIIIEMSPDMPPEEWKE